MKTLYVKDLQKGLVITGESFAISSKQRAEDKNGKAYYNITLADKTGKIDGKIWSDSLANINTKDIKEEVLVAISGRVDEYRGNLQINIQDLARVDEKEMDQYIESSQFDVEDMMVELESYIEKLKNPGLSKLLNNIFADESFISKYKYWPAAKSIHHDFRSGMLQHVLEMLNIAESMRKFYPELNYDVLYAGIILHDAGKIYELSGGISNSYTKSGSLIGHIVLGTEIVDQYDGKNLLDGDLYIHLKHLILSHHGKLEYASPVVPATPEAIALYYIDGVSSKTRGALKAVSDIGDEDEFGRYSMFFENARFWKNHNKNMNESNTKKDGLEKKSLQEEDKDQMSLV